MAKPVPPTPDVVFEVPQRVLYLAEALAPVARSARRALVRKVISSDCEFEALQGIQQHMAVITHALSKLQARVDGLMTDVIHNEKAGALDAGRSAGRLEQVLFELVDGYLDAKACAAVGESVQARSLILAVYRHHILAICTWLDAFVKAITLPATTPKKQQHQNAAGDITVTVVLSMSVPLEMAQLKLLAARLLQDADGEANLVDCQPAGRRQAVGFLDRVGALAFGLGVTHAALGRDHG